MDPFRHTLGMEIKVNITKKAYNKIQKLLEDGETVEKWLEKEMSDENVEAFIETVGLDNY